MPSVETEPRTAPPGIADHLADLTERLRRVTVEIRGRGGFGSGVIWGPDGLIVTSAHVTQGHVAVALADGRVLAARVVRRDVERDLAALRVDAGDLPAAAIGDPDALRAGELVFAVGSPLGLTGALTAGVVHAVRWSGRARNHRWIVADLRLAPGNSGGPLADARGRVVGVNAMVHGGLALAVPAPDVRWFLDAP